MSLPISIINWPSIPDSAALGNVYYAKATELGANNVVNKHGIAAFADTATKIRLPCRFKVPSDYIGTSAQLRIKWFCVATTGNAIWDFDARSIAVGESTDQATFDEGATVTTAAQGTARNMQESVIALTANKYSANEEVQSDVSRDGASSDTIAGTLGVIDVYFECV